MWSSCVCVCLYGINSLLLGCLQVNYSIDMTDNGWNDKNSQARFFPFPAPSSLYRTPQNLRFPLETALRRNAAHSSSVLPGWTLGQHIHFSTIKKIIGFFSCNSSRSLVLENSCSISSGCCLSKYFEMWCKIKSVVLLTPSPTPFLTL